MHVSVVQLNLVDMIEKFDGLAGFHYGSRASFHQVHRGLDPKKLHRGLELFIFLGSATSEHP